MSLDHGRDHLAIPGPSVMPDRVLRAMHRAAPNIYEGELLTLTATLFDDLKTLAGCSGDCGIFIGNGHAVWEASICNTLSRGDKALALLTGRFGTGWLSTASELGVDMQSLDFGNNCAVDSAQLEQLLRDDTRHEIKAVLTVQTDTATSVSNDIAAIRRAIDAASHPALLLVDCIASFACEPFKMDELGVDVMITACQKGLMTPPGVAFMFTSEKFWGAYAKADLITPYWNFKPRAHPALFQDYFCGTAPTHHLYGLREAVNMLQEEGIEHTWKRHAVMAEAVWAAVAAWDTDGDFSCNIKDQAVRSLAVTSICTADNVAARLREWCQQQCGLTLGIGLNPVPGAAPLNNLFRIGHMGHLNPGMLLGTLGTIEAGLAALDIQRGAGAVDAAAYVIASFNG